MCLGLFETSHYYGQKYLVTIVKELPGTCRLYKGLNERFQDPRGRVRMSESDLPTAVNKKSL